jgi:hypothetical protein
MTFDWDTSEGQREVFPTQTALAIADRGWSDAKMRSRFDALHQFSDCHPRQPPKCNCFGAPLAVFVCIPRDSSLTFRTFWSRAFLPWSRFPDCGFQ